MANSMEREHYFIQEEDDTKQNGIMEKSSKANSSSMMDLNIKMKIGFIAHLKIVVIILKS